MAYDEDNCVLQIQCLMRERKTHGWHDELKLLGDVENPLAKVADKFKEEADARSLNSAPCTSSQVAQEPIPNQLEQRPFQWLVRNRGTKAVKGRCLPLSNS